MLKLVFRICEAFLKFLFWIEILTVLQRLARGGAHTQENAELQKELNPEKPIIDYYKRTDPGPKFWINGEMDETQATVYSQWFFQQSFYHIHKSWNSYYLRRSSNQVF